VSSLSTVSPPAAAPNVASHCADVARIVMASAAYLGDVAPFVRPANLLVLTLDGKAPLPGAAPGN